MSEFRQQLLAVFDAEHKEHLAAIRGLLEDAATGRPDLREAFRRAHTLKGAARAVDLPAVEEVAHQLETLFVAVEAGERVLDPATIRAVEHALDAVEGLVAALGTEDAAARERALAQAGAALRRGGVTSAPPPGPAVPEAAPARGPAPAQAEPPPAAAAPPGMLRVAAEQVDRLSDAVHLLAVEVPRQEGLGQRLRGLEAEARALARSFEALRPGLRALTGRDGLAASLTGFERELMGLLRGLGALSRTQRAAAWSLGQAAQAVRDAATRLSLVPAEEVLGALARMARDMAREEGREVVVRLEGMDLLAERRVLQVLKDPALHMLRNAIGHGIEPPEERMARGKPAQAELGLRLAAPGGRLVLTVWDDGRGPDLARIEEVAVARGLLPAREPSAPPPPADALLALVFEPGFSTAAEVDRLSGRGMGLSVVAEAARALRGGAQFRARAPQGAEIELSVPRAAALQPLLLMEARGQLFALPSHGVERLLRLPVAALDHLESQPVLRVPTAEGEVVAPVLPLATLVGLEASALPEEGGYLSLVLLRRAARICAVAVEVLRDVVTVPVTDLDTPGIDADIVTGGALLDDDTPVLVLSSEGLVGRWLRDRGRLAPAGIGLTAQRPDVPPARRTILVVDDSITTRTLEKSILEAQGYRVLLSVDGLDALGRLRGGEGVDLVVADVEMPRMDGFALLQAMKTDPVLAPIPVILMTSRADPADVRRGLELGAGAYVTKQKFDQRELLATIGQLL